MFGGKLYNALNLNNESDILNNYQNIIKTKDLLNQTKIETKNKNVLNKINITDTDTKNQNSECLIKYFEGMMLNYIYMYESKGVNMDELKKFILSENKYDKFKKENNNITNTLKGGNYSLDTLDSPYTLRIDDTNNDWGIINIDYHRTFQTTYKNSEYKICISHLCLHTDNAFNIEIDFKNCKIKDNNYKIYNDLYTDSSNITNLLKIIIKKLIDYDYNDSLDDGNLQLIDDINNIRSKNSYNFRVVIKSIISTLILILTIRTGTDKNIYKTFNNTFLLSGISKFLLTSDLIKYYDYTYSLRLFYSTNFNQLTFEEKDPYNNIIAFHGDCTLNVLMCITKPEIKELLVEKINYIDYNRQKYTKNEYYNEIRNVLNNFNFNIISGTNYITLISNYVDRYSLFIDKNNSK